MNSVRKIFDTVRHGATDAYHELKDAVVERKEASDDLVVQETPSDRWFTPKLGWAKEVAPLSSTVLATQNGYKISEWAAPPLLCPTSTDADTDVGDLFKWRQSVPKLGEIYVEVLAADGLPNSLLQGGVVDPYAVVVFEGGAGRTSQVRNDTSPRWGADAPRAFKFDIRCPYSLLHVALLDDDRFADDPLGRVVINICHLFSHTTYDCYCNARQALKPAPTPFANASPERRTRVGVPRATGPLQYSLAKRHVRSRGAVRLRVCVMWERDRARLLRYTTGLPTFVLPFVDAEACRVASFAVQGRHRHPGVYQRSVLLTHMSDLRRELSSGATLLVDALFWRWPRMSAFVFVLWQLLVSYPSMLPASVPLLLLACLLRAYATVAARPKHPLDNKLTIRQLVSTLVMDAKHEPIAHAACDEDEETDGEDDEDDEDEEADDQRKRAAKKKKATALGKAAAMISSPAGGGRASAAACGGGGAERRGSSGASGGATAAGGVGGGVGAAKGGGGTLDVVVGRAHGLPGADRNGKSDAYVMLKVGAVTVKTATVPASPRKLGTAETWHGKAVWNARVSFVAPPVGAPLELTVMDRDASVLDFDDVLGRACVELTACYKAPGMPIPLEVGLETPSALLPCKAAPGAAATSMSFATLSLRATWQPDGHGQGGDDAAGAVASASANGVGNADSASVIMGSNSEKKDHALPPASTAGSAAADVGPAGAEALLASFGQHASLALPPDMSVERVLPTLLPPAGSLQEHEMRILGEVEQEVRGEYAPDQGLTLNPLAPLLGPLQELLFHANVQLRLLRRAFAWDDRILTFQLMLALGALTIALAALGWLATYLPWALMWEWALRLVGVALLGPHMRWVGQHKRREWQAYYERSRWFEHEASATERRTLLEEHRTQCRRDMEALVQAEMDPQDPPEVRELEGRLRKRFKTLLLRPTPTAAKLRYPHQPQISRSLAYPGVPACARPPRSEAPGAAPLVASGEEETLGGGAQQSLSTSQPLPPPPKVRRDPLLEGITELQDMEA